MENSNEFVETVVKSLRSIFENLEFLFNKENIYVFTLNSKLENNTSIEDIEENIAKKVFVTYYEYNTLCVDKALIVPMTIEYLQSVNQFYTEEESEEFLKGFTVACQVFNEIVAKEQQSYVS